MDSMSIEARRRGTTRRLVFCIVFDYLVPKLGGPFPRFIFAPFYRMASIPLRLVVGINGICDNPSSFDYE